ncbi:hypothetical protein H6F77_20800 [Microcoleus sp. FACHB-831]|uniref:hypothetical protein n=1 Tax=Microcoleus sp. FACHB-831 TaxID=2692827 RepID=UPI001681DDD0|nr:hypothetical protein [Microcoleus sp. FACHB-831]MBD1923490.1 hypothetical protein [Microcoleus sp. FACHB-831]
MNHNYEDRVFALVEQADALDYGTTKVSLLEEAVKIADIHNDLDLGFWTRDKLLDAATFSGYPEKELVTFSWCLAQSDRHPEKFSSERLLWQYKWVGEKLPKFPQISKQQIDDTFEDMARRYQRASLSMRSVYKLQCLAAMVMGDKKTASAYQQKWEQTPRDCSSDCPACELHEQVNFLIYMGEYERAIACAYPILSGKQTCSEIPHLSFGKILVPLLRLGRIEEAMHYHVRGYRLISSNRDFLETIAEHLKFLVLTNNLVKAVELFEKHLIWALETANVYDSFCFYLAANFLMTELQENGKNRVSLILPKSFSEYQQSGTYEVDKLRMALFKKVQHLAAKFNERNGNDYFNRLIVDTNELKKVMAPFTIKSEQKLNG